MGSRQMISKARRSRYLYGGALFAALLGLAAQHTARAQVPAVAEPAAPIEHHAGTRSSLSNWWRPTLPPEERFYSGLFGLEFPRHQDRLNQLCRGVSRRPHDRRQWSRRQCRLETMGGRHGSASSRPAMSTRWRKPPCRTAPRFCANRMTFPIGAGRPSSPIRKGAVFAVLSSSTGDTPDYLASPGAWIWSSLMTTDPDTDAGFYQKLFNYEVYDTLAPDGAEHLTLATEDYARASANPLPANKPNVHPHWLNYVRSDRCRRGDREGCGARRPCFGSTARRPPWRSGRCGCRSSGRAVRPARMAGYRKQRGDQGE